MNEGEKKKREVKMEKALNMDQVNLSLMPYCVYQPVCQPNRGVFLFCQANTFMYFIFLFSTLSYLSA
ncbi:MAG: hypothetical protein FD181_107 [Prolixibacteraceae bacterium]|nr:MAG: hypothetical protein FD181_107 [Prolixibacteraceae bacterium]